MTEARELTQQTQGIRETQQTSQTRQAQRAPSTLLSAVVLVLSLGGVATSVYLTWLYMRVTEAMSGGAEVDSFCNISEGMNCDAVAASKYADFLGVPISVWGLEYFVAIAALVVGCRLRWIPVRRWDAIVLWFGLIGVPVTIVLAWIAAYLIKSMCIMCMLVYSINAALVLVVGVPHIRSLKSFLGTGIEELGALLKVSVFRVLAAFVVVYAVSQVFWIPKVMGRSLPDDRGSLAVRHYEPGRWLGLEASGKTLGPKDAPIVIEEFTDFECPFCSRAHDIVLKVVEKYPGQIHLIHRDFPLDHKCNSLVSGPFHEQACAAARYGQCAAKQELFWPYEALLFHNQRNLELRSMMNFARQVGLDVARFEACLESEEIEAALKQDIAEGLKRQIPGTPATYINGEAVQGFRPLEFWVAKVESLLAARGETSTDAGAEDASSTQDMSRDASDEAVVNDTPTLPLPNDAAVVSEVSVVSEASDSR